MNFKDFIFNEQPAPPPGDMGGMGGGGDIPGGIGGAPLPTGGPGAGPGGPPGGMDLGGLGGPGMGGPDQAAQVPPKEIKSKNIWNVLEKILSNTKKDDTKNKESKAKKEPEPSIKKYKSLRI